MPRKLIKLKINRVDLVDRGANQHAEIVLTKRVVAKDSPSLSSVHVEAPIIPPASPKKKKPTTNGEKSVGKDLLKRLLALFGETDVEKRKVGLAELTKAVEDEPEVPVAKAHDPSDPNCNCADCMEKKKNMPVPDLAMAKRFEDLEKRNTDLQKSLDNATAMAKAERDARLDRDMLDVLKSFKATPLNIDLTKADNDVVRFRKMQIADPDTFNRTMEILKATDAQLAQSAIYSQFGSGRQGDGTGSAWAKIEAKADALIEKSANPMTREAAINKVMEQNPKLVAEYRAEQQ
jgi:hypothetical protein